MAGRPPAQLDTYFDQINTMYSEQGLSVRHIASTLNDIYSINISHTTVSRKVRQWGLVKGQIPCDVIRNQEVIAFVKQEWKENCTHQEILSNISRAMPHIQITDRQLRELRENEKIMYRRRGDIPPEEQDEAREAIEAVLIVHGGAYGSRLVQVALRQEDVLVSISQVQRVQTELDPEGICYIFYPGCRIYLLNNIYGFLPICHK